MRITLIGRSAANAKAIGRLLKYCKACDILLTMKTVKSTLTSKNQITIPVEFVRKMNLRRNRQFQVRQRGNDLILTPLPSLEEALQPVWKQASAIVSVPQSDEEIQASLRKIASRE